MDPLSITAGGLAIITAVNQIRVMIKSIKNGPEEFNACQTEIDSFYAVLLALEVALQQSYHVMDPERQHFTISVRRILDGCEEVCQSIKSIITKGTEHSLSGSGEAVFSFKYSTYRAIKKGSLVILQTRLATWKASLICVLQYSTL